MKGFFFRWRHPSGLASGDVRLDPQNVSLETVKTDRCHCKVEEWHSKECKLTPTLTFDVLALNSNKCKCHVTVKLRSGEC